ncbi:hypothetical protein F5148DRAFT_585958 [Russula earlei]|uniref:Uncharacterized protein n=1 Tax=Russula earlei TaxID=71964 RepID=A0ACC0TWI3_9AGAM|nr:hypothetical protein F5148DRAFT_585958 [Russula earlei]
MQGRVLRPDHGKRCSESVDDGLAPIPLTSSEDPPAIELPTIEGTSPHLENQTKSASTSSLKSAPLGHSRLLGDGDENTKVEHHPPNFTVPIAPLSAPLQPPTVSAGPKDLSPSPPPVPPHNNSRKKRPGTRPLSSHGSLSADEWDVDWDGWGTDGWNTDARHTGGWGHNAPRASGWDDAALGTVGWGDDSDAWSIEEWGTGGWEARRMARSPRRSRNMSSKFAGVSVDLPPSGTRSGRNSVIHPKASSPRPSTLRKSYTLPVEASDVVAPRLSLSTSLPVPIHQGPQWEPLIPEVLAAMEKVASDTETLLQVAEDGTVSAGNLEGLISRIIDGTTDPSKDNRFRATFLTTYQLFSTSTRLFEILKKRFESAGLNPANARSQYSILLFIESWIKKGFEDEDLTCSSKIRGFALSISGPEDLNAKAAEIASMIFNPDYVYLRQPRGIAWLANKPVARPPGMRAV